MRAAELHPYGKYSRQLKYIDSWIRNRPGYWIYHDWKRWNENEKILIGLGIDPNHTYAWSRMGAWAIAQSPIMGTQ